MPSEMIRPCIATDFAVIANTINDGAKAYAGVVPADRLNDPYMDYAHLQHELDAGVRFYGYEADKQLCAVMGIQDVQDVTLIRHAYVRTVDQGRGMGSALLRHVRKLTERPMLVGAWADAGWAIRFYTRHGFEMVSLKEKGRLLRTYWTVPERQIETSVVLGDDRWRGSF